MVQFVTIYALCGGTSKTKNLCGETAMILSTGPTETPFTGCLF